MVEHGKVLIVGNFELLRSEFLFEILISSDILSLSSIVFAAWITRSLKACCFCNRRKSIILVKTLEEIFLMQRQLLSLVCLSIPTPVFHFEKVSDLPHDPSFFLGFQEW